MTWANRVPLLFSPPQQRYGGVSGHIVRESFAELVDVMPTLCDLAGIPVPPTCSTPAMSKGNSSCTEGASLKPLITQGPAAPSAGSDAFAAAFGQWPGKGDKMGYNIFTYVTSLCGSEPSLVRYTEWVTYDKKKAAPIWDEVAGVELYNRTADPNENQNIAARPGVADVVRELSRRLRAGWRGKVDASRLSSSWAVDYSALAKVARRDG